jgi:hypothetical protein
MEVSDGLAGVREVFSRLFGRVVIPNPLNSILQARTSTAASFPAGIQDLFYFPFLQSFDFDWRRGFGHLFPYGVLSRRL